MLTPKQIDDYARRAAELFDPLADDILRDMARRIARANYMTTTAKWQVERMQALGASTQYLMQQMQALGTTIAPQAARIFAEAMLEADRVDAERYTEAGMDYVPMGRNAVSQQLVNSGFRRTMNTLANLTQTRAVMGNGNMVQTQQRQLSQLLDQAHMQIASGAFSLDSAVGSAVRELADDGLGAIIYPSGHVDKLDVVVLRALRTGINQTAGDISLNNAETMGVDLMELSAHGGARVGDGGADLTNHSWWQGKLVSLSGQPGYLTLDDIGYGDVRGFMGANCRHNWFPFFEGASVRNWTEEQLEQLNAKTVSYNGQKLTEAEADAAQRALERQVRRWKRRYALSSEAGMDGDAKAAATRLSQAQARLADFIDQTGRKLQPMRTEVNTVEMPRAVDLSTKR